MISVIQLVKHASVVVDEKTVGTISHGILALIGMEKADTEVEARNIVDRIVNYRIFRDAEGKTNLNLQAVNGGLLLVPQFTLVADTKKGTRPGFSKGMPGPQGKILFEFLVNYAKSHYANVAAGEFGAYMQVTLCNDGPMTFILD